MRCGTGMALCSPGVVAGTLQHPLSMGADTASHCLPLVGKFREGRRAPREPWQDQHPQHPQLLAKPNREPPPGMLCSPASRKQTCRAPKGSCTAPLGGLLYLNSAPPPVVSNSQVVLSVGADTGSEMNERSKGCTTVCGLQFFGLSTAGLLALWLEKAGFHHRQKRMVRASWGTEEETRLSFAITDPHTWEYATVKVRAAAGPAGPLGSEVPLLETQVAASLGASKALEGHLGPH